MNTTTIDLNTVVLDSGAHKPPVDGGDCKVCAMEAYNLAYYGDLTDECPPDVSPVLHAFTVSLNDSLNDVDRQRIRPFLPRLRGTRGDGKDEARGWLAIDWRIRTYTPAWLELAGLTEHADALRGLGRILDRASWIEQREQIEGRVSAARSVAYSVADSAAVSAAYSAAVSVAYSAADSAAVSVAYSAADSAADSAAYSAADSAAVSVAYSAADSAAYSAAVSAAYSAAYSVADSAARSAARSAAVEKLAPTAKSLQDSAFELYAALIAGQWPAADGAQ